MAVKRRDRNVAIGGQAYSLTVLAPIRPGHEQGLREAIAGLDRDGPGPFALVPTVHFARLVIIDRLPHEGPPRRRQTPRVQHLLFSSVFDGDPDRHLDELCRLMPDALDAVFAHCLGAPLPAGEDPRAFRGWIRRHQIETAAFFAPYGEATVAQVRASLALRERIASFAVRTQYAPGERLREQFERELRS